VSTGGLQPHRVENSKFSKDPQFVEKVRDIVGLPPVNVKRSEKMGLAQTP